MKFKLSWLLLSILSVPGLVQALSFHPDTIFLVADNASDCEAQGGSFTEWYEEIYCTKAPVNIAFSDVSREHPHSEAIAYVESEGIVSGYEDGTFKPEKTINRVELLKILVESEYRQEPACALDYQYTDTYKESWYQRYVQVASCLEIVEGYPDGSFKPAAPVYITEASKMISNTFGFVNNVVSVTWYDNYVRNLSLRNALPTTIETINSELTRGQMAEIIFRLKTGRFGLASHSLMSLEAGIVPETMQENLYDVDADLNELFEDLNLESFLDL
jgi:hypothetical protein